MLCTNVGPIVLSLLWETEDQLYKIQKVALTTTISLNPTK
jgi:hypothetical protein